MTVSEANLNIVKLSPSLQTLFSYGSYKSELRGKIKRDYVCNI